MNWGNYLVVGMIAFMSFIVGSVLYMVNQDTDSLEQSDYYDIGLHYSEEYTRKENLSRDKATPILRIKTDTLLVYFAKPENNGTMWWKRPSDGRLDREESFRISGENLLIPIATYASGHWQIQLRWESHGVQYQSDHNLFVP